MLKTYRENKKSPRFCVGENGLCLRFFDSANRTLSSTSTAIYAEVCGNFALVANFADCVARANTNAIFTSNTIVADFVSHSDILLFWVDSIIRPKKIFVYCFSAHCDTMRANNFLFDNVGAPVAPFNEHCQHACNRQINVGNRLQKTHPLPQNEAKTLSCMFAFVTQTHIYTAKIQTCLKRFSC